MKNKYLFGLVLISLVACSHNTVAPTLVASNKSSVIPEKREFPVNAKVNPCENFFEYACSNVIDSFQLRDDRSRHDFAFDDSNERILDYKKKYFITLSTAKPTSEREAQLKNVYAACMNEPGRTNEEKALVAEAKTKLASFKSRDELLSYLQNRMVTGERTLLEFENIANQAKPTKNDLALGFDLMSYPEKSYYENAENLKDLENLLTDFFTTVQVADPKAAAQRLLALEIEFSKIYPTPTQWRELYTSETKISKAELLKKYPSFKIEGFLNLIPDSTLIRDFEPKTFEFVNDKLTNMPVADLQNLYLYHSLVPYLDDAYPEFFKKRFDFAFKHLGGPKVRPDRQERCTTLVMKKYSKELDSILWTRLFQNFPKKRVVALGERIRKSILESLKKNDWLSKQAKAEAIQKIKTMKLQLVSPNNDKEWDFNPKGFYSADRPIKNSIQLSKLLTEKTLAELKKDTNPYRWAWGPLIVNAYYSVEFNKFVLPVGILQPPFFDPSLSDEENLGGLGTVIGHEMGHSIDDQGAKFDSHGVLKSWRTEADSKEFAKRTGILVEQFNAAGHNGKLTLGENIGDNVGLTASYQAASTSKKFDNETRKKFFLQYAHLWCGINRPSFEEQQLKTNPHALGWARTNQQVMQQAAFREAYQCRAGDKMTLSPEKTVHIW
jgi:putative endopeptidase